MTAEGIFPKNDGDVLYASEVNRLAKAGEYISIGSFAVIGSNASQVDAGSIVIPSGTLTNSAGLYMTFNTTKISADNLYIYVSGASVTGDMAIGANRTNPLYIFQASIGNPFAGFFTTHCYTSSATQATDSINYATRDITNLSTDADIVIKFRIAPSANFQIKSYNLQSFRSSQ